MTSLLFLLVIWALTNICYQHVDCAASDCKQHNLTLECSLHIPPELPNGVQEVYIKNYMDHDPILIPDTTNWKHIIKLDVTLGPGANGTLQSNTFIHLLRLKVMGLHGSRWENIKPDALRGLTQIEQLDFSGCIYLEMPVLLPALEHVSFRNLSTLNLHGLSSLYGNHFVFNQRLLEFLAKSCITYLDISETNILLRNLRLPQKPLKVEILQASKISMIVDSADQSNLMQVILLSNLRVVYFNNIDGKYQVISFHVYNTVVNICPKWGKNPRLEVLYANNNGNKNKPNVLDNVEVNVFGCKFDMTTLHIRGNNIRKLNATLNWPGNLMQDIDMSNNHIEYISPAMFNDLKQLKSLLLANNSLHNMQWDKEFELLIVSCGQLQQLSLAQNRLSYIPENMVQNNRELRYLDLSHNWLETIHFDLKMLVHLERLYLNGNKVLQIDPYSMAQLSNLLDSYSYNKTKTRPVIDLGDNPFVCLCDSVKSVQWLVTYLIPADSNLRYRCTLEDKTVELNKDALERSEYLCKRTTIIVVSTITSCAVIFIACIVIIVIVRRIRKKQQKNKKEQFLNDFKAGNLKNGDIVVKHLAFVSHCSADLHLVAQYIYNEMDRIFRGIIHEDRDTVAYGDKCFRPGFHIVTEAMQCLSESCVAICVISRSFCESRWCQMEVKEAYEQQKPIVLIFTEHVEEELMSGFLLNIYRRFTRARITRRDGQYVLEPTWEVFCDSVVALACLDAQKRPKNTDEL